MEEMTDNVELTALSKPSSFTPATNNNEKGPISPQIPKDTSTTSIDSNISMTALEILQDWCATFVVGSAVVSYWRGTWVLWDLYTCPDTRDGTLAAGTSFCHAAGAMHASARVSSAWWNYGIGNILLLIGIAMLWTKQWQFTTSAQQTRTVLRRTVLLYILGLATVCLWRGIWYLTDAYVLTSSPLTSYWLTSLGGMTGCFLLFAGPSLLAPPAIFNMDGPGQHPPPISVTIVSSYYSIVTPAGDETKIHLSRWFCVLDGIVSWGLLPILVVWFWRGTWLLLDHYQWGFTESDQDVRQSIGYSLILAIVALVVGSDDVVTHVPSPGDAKLILSQVLGRIRTAVLAVGAVSFWRAVWMLWDEFAGINYASAWISHWLGLLCLASCGCMACITAPPSTLGVDAIAPEDAVDEPLFHDVPIPAEALSFFAIARMSPHIEVKEESSHSFVSLQRPTFAAGQRLSRKSLYVDSSLRSRTSQKRMNNQFFRSR